MLAKKCDRCGRYYDHYGINNKNREAMPNGVNLVYITVDHEVTSLAKNSDPSIYDLCIECMRGLVEYLHELRSSEVKA